MHTVGRLLRTLRLAAGLTVTDAAVEAGVTEDRIRSLEAGLLALGYGDGITLAKAYLLCPTCFARHFRGAIARDGVLEERSDEDR